MSRSGQPPDLKKYMDKKLQIKMNANRVVIGTLRGFDQAGSRQALLSAPTNHVECNPKNVLIMIVAK
uniref:Small nuclear ribonucleoprotein G n=1 Tax=Zea mays TaxID=4577 RepID=B6TUK1_MAIZE|nr:small nuclear ribonucleoprotein G [Zea mays]